MSDAGSVNQNTVPWGLLSRTPIDLVVRPWCISEIVNAHEDCPELQAILEEYHKPVVIDPYYAVLCRCSRPC